MKIAILKPDHLGDLILSSPAINKLLSLGHDITLIINKNSDFLARYLFPNVEIKHVTFSHLSRVNETNSLESIFEAIDSNDKFISLRRDPQLESLIFTNIPQNKSLIIENSLEIHETVLQANCIQSLTGPYTPVDFFNTYNQQVKLWPRKFENIGFVISAGFFNNSLSIIKWYEFAQYFMQYYDSNISLIGGPNEKHELNLLKCLIKNAQVIQGSREISNFLENVVKQDLLIATDSGTAHLCSLSGTPIISLFGASPHIRFQPIGRFNKVISLSFNCSPCPQFETLKVNRCITKECLNSITVNHIKNII